VPHFCVALEGSGINIPSSDAASPIVGFYSVSRMSAASPAQASELAVSRCRENLSHAIERRGGDVSGLAIVVESVVRCSWLKAILWPGGRFIFFPADDA